MKDKMFFLVMMILLAGNLIAYTNYEGLFTMENPSATTVAFGNESGTAYIWGNNPLNSWSNPALLAYNNGLSLGWSHDPWFESVISDMYFSSSYISFANQNFGLLFPMINSSNKFGTTFDYGTQEIYNAQGELMGTYHSYETYSRFAIGKKIFRINFAQNNSLNPNSLIISAGYDLKNLNSGKINWWTGQYTKASGIIHGFGLLAHYIYNKNQTINNSNHPLQINLTTGMYYMNIFKNEMKMKNQENDVPIPHGCRIGLSGKVSYDLWGNELQKYIPLLRFKGNLSICYVFDTDFVNNSFAWGHGFEFGLFETIFLRLGNYQDKDGHIEGNTFGVGFKFNIYDVIHFEYNYATFPSGELLATQSKDDLMISVDLMKVLGKK